MAYMQQPLGTLPCAAPDSLLLSTNSTSAVRLSAALADPKRQSLIPLQPTFTWSAFLASKLGRLYFSSFSTSSLLNCSALNWTDLHQLVSAANEANWTVAQHQPASTSASLFSLHAFFVDLLLYRLTPQPTTPQSLRSLSIIHCNPISSTINLKFLTHSQSDSLESARTSCLHAKLQYEFSAFIHTFLWKFVDSTPPAALKVMDESSELDIAKILCRCLLTALSAHAAVGHTRTAHSLPSILQSDRGEFLSAAFSTLPPSIQQSFPHSSESSLSIICRVFFPFLCDSLRNIAQALFRSSCMLFTANQRKQFALFLRKKQRILRKDNESLKSQLIAQINRLQGSEIGGVDRANIREQIRNAKLAYFRMRMRVATLQQCMDAVRAWRIACARIGTKPHNRLLNQRHSATDHTVAEFDAGEPQLHTLPDAHGVADAAANGDHVGVPALGKFDCLQLPPLVFPFLIDFLSDLYSQMVLQLGSNECERSRLLSTLEQLLESHLPLLLRYTNSKGQLDAQLSGSTIKFFTEKLNNFAMKLFHVLDDLRLSAYGAERVAVLRQIFASESAALSELSKFLNEHTAQREKFETLGQQFQKLLKEYKFVQSAIKENEWRFKKFDK